jgi:ubiquinone/menaquinone biosynthesis C-methylase UbiE
VFVPNDIPSDEDIFNISRGLISYCRRLLTQMSFIQGLPEILRSYRSILDISTLLKIKKLNLLRSYVLSLADLNVLEQKGDTFKWIGGEIRISEEEKKIEKLSPTWAVLSQFYSKRFPDILKGQKKYSFREIGMWDSLFSSELYQQIARKALDKLNLKEDSIVLDIGCKTGWTTLNILANYNFDKILAIDSNQQFLDVAEENMSNFIPEKRGNVNFICHDFIKELDLTKYYQGELPNKIIISYLFHWFDPEEYLNILNNIRKIIREDAQIIFIQPHIAHRNQSKFFEILLLSEAGFKGFPLIENFVKDLSSAGFSIPIREFNLFLNCKAELPVTREFKISQDPPKFCVNCGKELQKNTFYCAFCRTIVDVNLNFPLL